MEEITALIDRERKNHHGLESQIRMHHCGQDVFQADEFVGRGVGTSRMGS